MPILIMALVALAIFGLIGFLLASAAWCEFHKKPSQPARPESPKTVV